MVFRDLSITNEIAEDPSYVSQPHVTKPENYSSGIVGDISPLTFTELREMRDFDLSRLQEGEEGGKSLREKKPSFMSLDIYIILIGKKILEVNILVKMIKQKLHLILRNGLRIKGFHHIISVVKNYEHV